LDRGLASTLEERAEETAEVEAANLECRRRMSEVKTDLRAANESLEAARLANRDLISRLHP